MKKITEPRTAVVIVNYQGAKDTADCIQSLMVNNPAPRMVVIDNTPNDPLLERAVAGNHEIQLIRAMENLGFGMGNNLGIGWALKNTSCEFVFLLNNDATVLPDTIEKLEKALDDHPEAGVASPRIVLSEDPTRLWFGGGQVDWKRGSARVPGFLGEADAPLAISPRYISFATGCAMMIRKSVLESEKGFDSRFFMYEEDLELSLRIQKRGWRLWYEPAALVKHLVQGSQKNRESFVAALSYKNPNLSFLVYHIIKNRLLNMRIHAMGKNKLVFMIIFPIFLISKCIQWYGHGRTDALKSVAKALTDFWKEKKRVAI